MVKYFCCFAAGIAWTTSSATRLSLLISSSMALIASSLLQSKHNKCKSVLVVHFIFGVYFISTGREICDKVPGSHSSQTDKINRYLDGQIKKGCREGRVGEMSEDSISLLPCCCPPFPPYLFLLPFLLNHTPTFFSSLSHFLLFSKNPSPMLSSLRSFSFQ